ncbi:MAG TPA: TRAP transporter small permease [Hyphomicrobiaceae bacterium]
MISSLHQSLERLSSLSAWASGFALVAVALLVTVDVLCRKLLGATLAGSDEIAGYTLAGAASWSFSYCLLKRAHIRIDLLYNWTSLRVRCWLDLVALLALLLFMSLFTYRAIGVLVESIQTGATSNTALVTPLWIPQTVWVTGLIYFTFTVAVVTLNSIVLISNRDYAAIRQLAGIPTIEEEVQTETEGVLDTVHAR